MGAMLGKGPSRWWHFLVRRIPTTNELPALAEIGPVFWVPFASGAFGALR